MHSLFTENAPKTVYEKLKSASQINAIHISRTRIIHSFFRPKTAAVNKFCLLSLGKISFDRKILKAQNIFNETKSFSFGDLHLRGRICKSLPANSTSPRIISCKEISCVFHYRTTNECIPSYQEMGGSYNLIYRDGKITRTNSVDEIPGNYIYVVDPHVKNVIVEIDLLLGVAPLEKPQDVMYFRRTFRFVYKNGWKEDGPGISSKK
ncbi:MAG TPA: hypothetical protein VHY30_09070 [Verrucomicrobiae bacterium]|nr:hypothetical protein [Verrucomicrobiae bacterium]